MERQHSLDRHPSLKLDEKALNKFSRQNAALGAETTAKLIKMHVLVFGLRGVGAETCKNLALQGVGGITLVDSQVVEIHDLGVNFFFQESDVGKARCQVVLPKLKELNPLCSLHIASSLQEGLASDHHPTAVVITQPLDLNQLIAINEECRQRHISFFYAFTGGVTTDIFVDHGPDHHVHDFDGERPMQKIITNISQISTEEILIRYETPEGQLPVSITKGNFEISEVIGIEGVNEKTFHVKVGEKDPVKTIRIPYVLQGDEEYLGGGILTEKKIPTKYHMESLAEKIKHPGNTFAEPPSLVLTDLLHFGSEVQLHVAHIATLTFFSTHKHLPRANLTKDADEVVEIAKRLLSDKVIDLEDFELDVDLVKRYALHSGAELQPLAAFTGGVLAQEVVKCTGKFTPIPGYMHFAAFESLPDNSPDDKDTQPRNSPQDELAAVYGWPFVEKLGNLQYFMVGCGALGCEFMKNFALNNVCCGPHGKLTVTDADRIELSNLSRQFLFREHNVGQPKSKAAAAMAKQMNKNFHVEPVELLVGTKSEDTFDDSFWLGLDGVCNALDNMEGRLYVDRQCVKYEKPLLESGTMGTNGNVDTVYPFKTRTYAEGGKAAEGGGVPMCTLRNFPHLTDHCIEWSRDQFELLFVKLGKNLESYLADPTGFANKIRDKAASEPGAAFFDVRSVTSFAKLVSNPSIGSAAQLAYDIFHFLFRDRILDLQAAFPKDYRIIDSVTKVDKGPFWGDKKRYPTPAVFNPHDPAHTDFLLSAICLFGVAVGILPARKEGDDHYLEEFRQKEWIINIAEGLRSPAYVQAPVSSDGMEEAASASPTTSKESVDELLGQMLSDLAHASAAINKEKSNKFFEPADFEKDDDLNFHIAFVTAAANLRCDNYSIKRTDFQGCKVIAGKIIAAIATTTAAVCGLVILELFKVVLGKDTDSYMARMIGLGAYTYTSFTADPPQAHRTRTEVVVPDPTEPLPEDAYDEHGRVKKEYCTTVVKRAYPEGHSVWDKLPVSADLTLREFADWLLNEHGLKLNSWDFVYAYKTVQDEETKTKEQSGVTATIYPIKPVLDYSLLPSLELTLAQASVTIMKTPLAKPTQQYVALWREFKTLGSIPAQPAASQDAITESSTLREILQKMNRLAEENIAKGTAEASAISYLEKRKFVLIPASETPSCVHAESGEEIEHLCALKILL
eukprot:scaffold3532_cov182-Ochromonas_danica.AAC.11